MSFNGTRHTPTANAVAQHLQRIKMAAEEAAVRPPVDVRQLILQAAGALTLTFMEPAETFDQHLVGAAEVNGEVVAVYNKPAVIAALAEQDGITAEEAFDKFNTSFGAAKSLHDAEGNDLPQMPLFLVDIRDL